MQDKITLEILSRSPFADGNAFGETGAYERLRGWAHHEIDSAAAALAGITDLDKAPVNADGLVEFSGEFYLLRPVDPEKGNRRLFFDFGNRGNMRALQFFNDAPHSNDPQSAAHAGNGFLMRRGYSFGWAAWQGDLLRGNDRMTMRLPVAMENGAPVKGTVRQEFIPEHVTYCFPLSGHAVGRSHVTTSLDTSKASLTRRRYSEDERIPISPDAWEFAQRVTGAGVSGEAAPGSVEAGLLPSDGFITLHEGFQPGWIYELIYEAKAPLVMGLGHIAVRNLVSFLKYGEADAAGAANPLAVDKAYGWGRSQTGRVIRDFIYRGFNADAAERKVFDGLMPHVSGAGGMRIVQRFANATTTPGHQYEEYFSGADRFPFSYAESTDHLTGKTDAILKRPESDPLVMHSQTGTEYWQRRGSLVHTDTEGNDLDQPDTVRVYFWSSSQHNSQPADRAPSKGICRHYSNIVTTSMLFRAMLDAMDAWASEGTPPPASRMPTRKDGTLVTFDEWKKAFPEIPGGMVPKEPSSLKLLDHGPDFDKGFVSEFPPKVIASPGYAVLVPMCDEDGNDLPGVRAPMVQAPMGTYVGWNLRERGYGYGATFETTGSYIPFPDSAEERAFVGDPRKSVLERYTTPEDYSAAIEVACKRLVEDGLMLEEDIEQALKTASDWGRPRHVTGL